MNREILERYRTSNPLKFQRKFGGKTIEEILGEAPPEPSQETSSIKVSVTTKQNIQPSFTDFNEEVNFTKESVFAPEPDVVIPKKPRNKKITK